MHPIGQTCIYVWVAATLIALISAIVFLIRLITKKNRKTAKRVFWIAIAVAIGAFILYGITSPITWCNHEYTTIIDQPATCTVDGKREQYCPLCDYTKKETFDATGHNMVTQSKREPTYEVDGELIEKCSVCGYEEITKIDILEKETEPSEITQSTQATTEKTEPTQGEPLQTAPVESQPSKTEPSDATNEKEKETDNPYDGLFGGAIHTDSEAWSCAKAIVKSYLKSSSSAKFCSFTEAEITDLGKGEYMVEGWVDAQNGYGATVRQYFIVTYTATRTGYKNGSALFI